MSAGHSVDAVLREPGDNWEHGEHAVELEQMLRLVEAIKELPDPVLPPGALARIERRAQITAGNRGRTVTEPGAASGPHPPGLRLLRPPERGYRKAVNSGSSLFGRDGALLRGLLRTGWAVGAVAALAVVTLTILGALMLHNQATTRPQQLESYTGTITSIEPGKWVLDDEAEVLVDALTEVHGEPSVGARMTCLAEQLPEQLPGQERYRALEVWILSAPGSPAEPGPSLPALPPGGPDGSYPAVRQSAGVSGVMAP